MPHEQLLDLAQLRGQLKVLELLGVPARGRQLVVEPVRFSRSTRQAPSPSARFSQILTGVRESADDARSIHEAC